MLLLSNDYIGKVYKSFIVSFFMVEKLDPRECSAYSEWDAVSLYNLKQLVRLGREGLSMYFDNNPVFYEKVGKDIVVNKELDAVYAAIILSLESIPGEYAEVLGKDEGDKRCLISDLPVLDGEEIARRLAEKMARISDLERLFLGNGLIN